MNEPIKCRENHGGGCRNVAVAQLRLACVHEHIYWTAICAEHLARLKRGAPAQCHLCAHGEAAHECKMRTVPKPRERAA